MFGVTCAIRDRPRLAVQTRRPVRASKATMNALSHGICQPVRSSSVLFGYLPACAMRMLPSYGMMSKPSCSRGDAPSPCRL